LGKVFKLKPIKRESKIPLWTVQIIHSNIQMQMSSQNNNNNYATVPISLNSYITRKLNNIDKAKMMKAERDDWTRTYHKMLKGLEAMINMQKQIQQ